MYIYMSGVECHGPPSPLPRDAFSPPARHEIAFPHAAAHHGGPQTWLNGRRRRAVACQEVAAAPSSASERRKVYKLHMAALRDELYSIPSDVSNPETVRVALEMARLASLDGWTLCPTALFLEYHTL